MWVYGLDWASQDRDKWRTLVISYCWTSEPTEFFFFTSQNVAVCPKTFSNRFDSHY